ncbi:MAG: D-Ala-D-Ala carboxypeptidase family metallohydrolase [Fusobacteriaceae bacterium]
MKKILQTITILSIIFFFTGCSSIRTPNRNKKISRNFSMGEAVRENVKIDKKTEKNIYYTAKRMEEFRKLLGEPVNVLSWYRSPKANANAGGAKNSAHLQGLAVDFRTKNSTIENYKKITNSKLSYDLIIYYKSLNMIHLGFKKDIVEEKKMKLLR